MLMTTTKLWLKKRDNGWHGPVLTSDRGLLPTVYDRVLPNVTVQWLPRSELPHALFLSSYDLLLAMTTDTCEDGTSCILFCMHK